MSKIPTAEEFWTDIISSNEEFSMLTSLKKQGLHKHVFESMRRFTKLHVEAALKEANRKVIVTYHYDEGIRVNKDSILNAYPLKNIK